MGAVTEQRAAAWLREARAVTVLTGAGLSTGSGIPDFRGPRGLWTRDPAAQRMFSLDAYVADREVRVAAWRARREHPAWTARPNAAHHALVRLEGTGRLVGVITQNVDGLQQQAGSTPQKVIEVHGTLAEAECLTCGLRTPMAEVLARVDAGEADPPCRFCGGVQKSATISFGQALRTEVLRAATAAASACDLFLAVGTSLTVHPAAGLCDVALAHGSRLAVLNAEPTPYDDLAGVVLRDPVEQVLPRLVAAAG